MMMTSKEAFERMKNTLSVDLKEEFYIDDTVIKIDRELIEKDLDILYKLVERDTPIKPTFTVDSIGYNDCPVCDERFISEDNFCKQCGQKIDWSRYR